MNLLKKYEVSLQDWYGGMSKYFWLKKNAYEYAESQKKNWLWVRVIDKNGKKDTIKETKSEDYYRTEQGAYILKGEKNDR